MEKKQTILVVDDNTSHRIMLKTLLEKWGYGVFEADDGSTAIEAVKNKSFDLIVMDIRMVRVSGLDAMPKIKEMDSDVPIIIITAYASVETAVNALKSGAYDYITKPINYDKLKLVIQRATEHTRLRQENTELREQLRNQFNRQKIIGQSPLMVKLLKTVEQVAISEATVLIKGESGVGKELIAEAIHINSLRHNKPYIKINCAAITETLLESELFGHEKGSFTGADRSNKGCFAQAEGGSLFLDEVSEMSLNMQVKLLRAIQEKEITPVGGEKAISVNVRIIAATNKDLTHLIQEGLFRQDLFYRLNVVDMEIPPLRERKEDIPLLAQHFLDHFNIKNNKEIKGFSPEAMTHLVNHNWPGNVRELMNAVERNVVLTQANILGTESFPAFDTQPTPFENTSELSLENQPPVTQTLEELEKQAILKTLQESKGNKSEAARRLGITRKTLHKKLNRFAEADN